MWFSTYSTLLLYLPHSALVSLLPSVFTSLLPVSASALVSASLCSSLNLILSDVVGCQGMYKPSKRGSASRRSPIECGKLIIYSLSSTLTGSMWRLQQLFSKIQVRHEGVMNTESTSFLNICLDLLLANMILGQMNFTFSHVDPNEYSNPLDDVYNVV